MLHHLPASHPTETEPAFDLSTFGDVLLTDESCKIGFQLDVVPDDCPDQLIFGLVHLATAGSRIETGFAVRIDFRKGDVIDAMNDSGLLGWVEIEPMTLAKFDEEEPMLLSFEIEARGKSLLPTLRLGDEEFLYPAIRRPETGGLTAVAGARENEVIDFLYPSLWREQQAK